MGINAGRGGPGRHFEKFEKARSPQKTFFRLGILLKPHTGIIITAALLVITGVLCNLSGPWFMAKGIDSALDADKSLLLRYALLLIIIYALIWICRISGLRIMAKVSQSILRNLRKNVFKKIEELPFAFFSGNQQGDIMSRLTNDIDAVNQAIAQNAIELVSNFTGMTGIIIVMFVLNRHLAVLAIIMLPVFILITRQIAIRTRRGFSRRQATLGSLNGFIEENISALSTVAAFGRNEQIIKIFYRQNKIYTDISAKAQTLARMMMPLSNLATWTVIAVMAGMGGKLALNGVISVGTVAAFIAYTQRFMHPLRDIAEMYNTIQAALAGAERVFEILDLPGEYTPGESIPIRPQGLIEFRNVGFRYTDNVPVLENISFTASPGETVALVGPTGAGKTTIASLLSRFYDFNQGEILLDHKSITAIDKRSLRRAVGVVLQDTFLFSDTVMENIRFGRPDASDEEVKNAACLSYADHFIEKLSDGYHTILSERGSNISQGQRQLISIARILLADPALLILDEATSSVDTRTELLVQKALGNIMQGRTCLIIAHRLSTIKEADQVLVLVQGRIIERGKHMELLAAGGYYYRLYNTQYGKMP
ncbi:MAG: hypothetical protein A2096_01270 [Spirochaetes bacterium GWF1_41_5]|nr:MAG: hypothetical protein A2096_01270 [Spirochaetes bacterium GWF1_41_5]